MGGGRLSLEEARNSPRPGTSWVRFEGALRPHCFDFNQAEPPDRLDPEGAPISVLGNQDLELFVSRRSEPMPFYYRNADGDELIFVHRGGGTIETDFGPLPFEKGDLIRSASAGKS